MSKVVQVVPGVLRGEIRIRGGTEGVTGWYRPWMLADAVTLVTPASHPSGEGSPFESPLSHPSPLRNDGSHSACDISSTRRNPALPYLRASARLLPWASCSHATEIARRIHQFQAIGARNGLPWQKSAQACMTVRRRSKLSVRRYARSTAVPI